MRDLIRLALGGGVGLVVIAVFGTLWARSLTSTVPERVVMDSARRESSLPHCPVMTDEPINFAFRAPTDDGPAYFCCQICITRYETDPARYAEEIIVQRKALAGRARVQTTCPVCGEPPKNEHALDDHGRHVSFCRQECLERYQGEPAKYKTALAGGYTFQTKCPVCGESIDPKNFATLENGERVYFCRESCEKKFFADPGEYASNLAAQGYDFDPAELIEAPSTN